MTSEMCDFWGCASTSFNWDAMGALGTWFIGLLGLVVVVYQLWLQVFSNDIKVIACTGYKDIFHGEGFDVVLFNKTLAPKSITKIEIVVDNKYVALVKDFDCPLVLESHKTAKIIGDRFAYIDSDKNPPLSNCYFIVWVDGKKRFIKYKGDINKNNLSKLIPMSDYGVARYGDSFLSKDVCAVLSYRFDSKDDFHHIFILSNGLMDKVFLKFNKVPESSMKNIEELRKFFEQTILSIDGIDGLEYGIQGVLKWHNK